MKTEDIKKMAQAWNQVQEASYGKKKEAMDPVDQKELKGKHKDRKDKDIDNDGDVDKSDEYLHKRRKAVSKAIKGKGTETEVQTQESVEGLDELSKKTLGSYVKKAGRDMSDRSGDNSVDSVMKNWKREKGINKAVDRLTKEDLDIEEASQKQAQMLHRHMLKALGKSKLPKNHSYRSAVANNGDFVVQDGGGRVVGRLKKGEHDVPTKMSEEAKSHGNMDNGSPRGEGLSPNAKKELANKTPMNPATDQPTVDKKTFDAIRASGKKAPMRSNDNAQGDKTMPKIAEDAIEGKIHDGAMKDIKNHLKKTGEKLKTHKDVERYMDHSGDDHVVHHLDKHNGTDDHFNNVRNRISDHLSKNIKK